MTLPFRQRALRRAEGNRVSFGVASRKGWHRRGLTLIEVLISVLIMSIGLLAVVAMQGATVMSNMTSQDVRSATALAETLIERVKRDAVSWNAGNLSDAPPAGTLLATAWAVEGQPTPADWVMLPASSGAAVNSRFNDLALPGDANAPGMSSTAARFATTRSRYCAEFRVRDVGRNMSNATSPVDSLMIQVRIFFPRDDAGEALLSDCSSVATNRTNAGLRSVTVTDFVTRFSAPQTIDEV